MKAKRIAAVNFIILVLGTLVGFLALILVFCLPTEPMKQHLGQSLPIIEREFGDSELIPGNAATLTGNFTDCLMLENAVYRSEEHSYLEQVMFMYRGESGTGDGWAPGYSLVDYVEGVRQPREAEYSRYWHGYLVVLKPLLLLTTFNSIRVMAGILQLVLAGIIIILCGRRREDFLGTAFLLSVPCLYFFTMYFSLSLSICYYVMAAAVIIQLLHHEKLEQKGYYFAFFLIIGMATSYFDFLTYPLVTLGYPLCICLYLSKEKWQTQLKKLAGYSVEWSFGYLGLWAMKWILTDCMVGGHTLRDAVNTLSTRTESAQGYSKIAGFWKVIKQSIEPYTNWGFYLLVLGILIYLAVCAWRNRRNVKRESLLQGGVVMLVVLVPFAWLFLTQNHVEQHWMFTFKILAVSVFAGICAVGKVLGKGGEADG